MLDNPFLRDLTPEQYDLLSPLFAHVDFPLPTTICQQGRKADYLYFLLEGNVSVRYKPHDGPRITLTQLHPGDVFGWSAVIGNPTYTSDAVSTTAVRLLRVRGLALRNVCREYPTPGSQILEKLADAVAARWVYSRQQIHGILRREVMTSGES
jgi:CRP-like cAMP-binding protein